MTQPPFATGDAEVAKLFNYDAYYDTISDQNLIGMLLNRGVLTEWKDLNKKKGDKITYPFVGRIQAKGFTNNQVITGLENRPNIYSDSITLYELNQVSKAEAEGTISAQMTGFGDMEEVCNETNKMWLQERLAVGVVQQLTGNTASTITWDGLSHTSASDLLQVNAGSTPTAPTTGRIVRPNGNTTDEGVNSDTAATFKLSQLVNIERISRTTRTYLPPLSSDGVKWLHLVHPDAMYNAILDVTDPIQYRDIILSQIQGGSKKEFVSGETFRFMNSEIMITDKLLRGVHSSTSAEQTNTRRSVTLGKGAGCIAFGQGFSAGGETVPGFGTWTDDQEVKRINRYRTGVVWGANKNVFNSQDYATIVQTNYVAQ